MAPAHWLVGPTYALFAATLSRCAFDMSRSDNVVVYWGQSDDPAPTLEQHCRKTTADSIPIAFVSDVKGDFSHNSCSSEGCEHDVKSCQAQGKMLTISIGGADGHVTFSSADQAKSFGEMIYNTFLGGISGVKRPFGSTVLDGIDLDIENGNTEYYSDMVQAILSKNDGRKYYVTGAPQCPGPPDAYLKDALLEVPFDALYVQFYNNEECQLDPNQNNLNFGAWKDWMESNGVKKDTKIYIGAMADHTSTDKGYVEPRVLQKLVNETRNKYPDTFGGVMFWDAGLTYKNGIDHCLKTFLTTGNDCDGTTTSSITDGSASSSSTSTRKASKSTTGTGEGPSPTSTTDDSAPSSWATAPATTTSHKGKHTHTTSGDGDGKSSTVSTTASPTTTVSQSISNGVQSSATVPSATSLPSATETTVLKCKCAKPRDENTQPYLPPLSTVDILPGFA